MRTRRSTTCKTNRCLEGSSVVRPVLAVTCFLQVARFGYVHSVHTACRNTRVGVKTQCTQQVSVQPNRRTHMPQESWGAQSPQGTSSESSSEELFGAPSNESVDESPSVSSEPATPAIPAAAKRSSAKRSTA